MATATKPDVTTVGENVAYYMDGPKLVIEIDTEHRGEDLTKRVERPGKTIRVATTGGNKEMGGVIVGVNAYVYPPR